MLAHQIDSALKLDFSFSIFKGDITMSGKRHAYR